MTVRESVVELFLLSTVVVMFFIADISRSHPQCLDGTAPKSFGSDHQLPFCSFYRQDGCCKDTQHIEEQHDRIKALVEADDPELWTMCGHYVQEYLCQQCSPYAAHIFQMEIFKNQTNPIPRAFPGLCSYVCMSYYDNCNNLTDYFLRGAGDQYVQERLMYANVLDDRQLFCQANQLTDNDYCYSWILNNPLYIGQKVIETSSSVGCLCMKPFEEIQEMLEDHLLFLVNANDGSNRLFLGDQSGRVFVMYQNGSVIKEPFVTISEDMLQSSNNWDERGLLHMTFHPNFVANRKFYVYYSVKIKENCSRGESFTHKMRVEEMRASNNSPNLVDDSYRRVILEIYEPYADHNGGQMLFGDDGYLYVFVGDGGSVGDPDGYAQNLFSLLGKALRIDVDHPDRAQGKEYSIPSDNPFANGVYGLPEIFAYGLRNPWRCGKDGGDPVTGVGKGRIICGDVGNAAYEELDLIEKGANYGWKVREGPIYFCKSCEKGGINSSMTEPIFSYSHNVGKCVIGGEFYRGRDSPSLNGQYIYGDYENGQLYSLMYEEESNTWKNKQLKICTEDLCPSPLTNSYSTFIVSFGLDEQGEIYLLSSRYTSQTTNVGTVYKLVDPRSSTSRDSH